MNGMLGQNWADWGELTAAINKVPFLPGQIGRLGIFTERRQSTTLAMIEVEGERLALVPEVPRGAPPVPNVIDLRAGAAFRIPHFPIRDTLMADSIQNVRAFGVAPAELQGFAAERERRVASLSRKLDYTLEFLRLGACMGKVTTAVDRITFAPIVQRDLFAAFGVPPQDELEWPIVDAGRIGQDAAAWSAQLTELCSDLVRKMANEVPLGRLTAVRGVCGPVFFDAFATHPDRRTSFGFGGSNAAVPPTAFGEISFGNVIIEEYRGQWNSVPFVPADLCYFFPVGSPDLFLEVYAPADYMDSVNSLALPRYLRQEELDFQKGLMMEAQMNCLPLCTAPRALFTAKAVPYVP